MANKKKKDQAPPGAADQAADAGPPEKMKRKEYEHEMRILHGELVAMQEWVKESGAKICIVFEGRDTAGKGGHDQADHRAGQPARVPGHRAARPVRAGKIADVHPALPWALSGGWRSSYFRSQLV